MTESESDSVSAAVNALNWVLDRDLDEMCDRIRLSVSERGQVDRARVGVMDMLQTARNKACSKVNKLDALLKRVNSTDLQGELFDSNGKPLSSADANGKLIETERKIGETDFENDPTLEGLEPITPVEEPPTEEPPTEEPPAEEGPPVELTGLNWGVNPLRASDVMDLLLEQITAGAKKLHAIDAVVERTQWTKQQVQAAWNSLVETGTIARVGSVWKLVRQPEEPTVDATEEQAEEPTADPEADGEAPEHQADEEGADPEHQADEPTDDQAEEDDHRKAA